MAGRERGQKQEKQNFQSKFQGIYKYEEASKQKLDEVNFPHILNRQQMAQQIEKSLTNLNQLELQKQNQFKIENHSNENNPSKFLQKIGNMCQKDVKMEIQELRKRLNRLYKKLLAQGIWPPPQKISSSQEILPQQDDNLWYQINEANYRFYYKSEEFQKFLDQQERLAQEYQYFIQQQQVAKHNGQQNQQHAIN